MSRRRPRSLAWRRALLATALCALAAAALPAEAQIDEQVRVRFVRAEVAFRSGDTEAARALLDRVIEDLLAAESRVEADDLLLRRALIYRARIAWDAGDRDDVDDDLDLLLQLAPEIDLGAAGAPAELAARLEQRKERRIGYLRVSVLPQDARIRVDGAPVASAHELVPLAAGVHVVEASRPGYASERQEVDIRANRTEGIGFELERTSATVSIVTHPAGATVAIDGEAMGRTSEGGAEGLSAPLQIVGLLPGSHELTVTRADHRTFRQTIELPDLADYDLGTLFLERSLGILVLRGLDPEARVLVDGDEITPERATTGDGTPIAGSPARLSLPVGEHRIFVTSGRGVFERSFSLVDGDTVGLDVQPRPGLAFLGVSGGEDLDRLAANEAVRDALGRLDGWFVLEREDRVAGLGRLPSALEDSAGWQRFAADVAADEPAAALWVIGTISGTGRAASFELWVQAPPPGPSTPWRLEVDLAGGAVLDDLVEALRRPLPEARAWLGATLIDTLLEQGVRVLDVEASGPAGQAGLRAGDLIVGLDGEPAGRARRVLARVADADPFESLTLEIERDEARQVLAVRLGSSPVVAGGPEAGPPPVVWAAATSRLADPGSTLPAWALELHRALALLRDGDAAAAADLLGDIQVTGDPPFGQGAVDYWRGVALVEAGGALAADIRAAFGRAQIRPGARLEHNDGPYVGPRARVRQAAAENGDGDS